MTQKRKLAGWLGAAVILAAIPSCGAHDDDDESCATYACLNTVKLSGALSLPEGAAHIDAKYCRAEHSCVEGELDLAGLGTEPSCITSGGFDDDVCISRSARGQLQVEASLYLEDAAELPPDGERYRLLLVDHDSGEVLLDEARVADYEVTRQDSCHLCWDASMRL